MANFQTGSGAHFAWEQREEERADRLLEEHRQNKSAQNPELILLLQNKSRCDDGYN